MWFPPVDEWSQRALGRPCTYTRGIASIVLGDRKGLILKLLRMRID